MSSVSPIKPDNFFHSHGPKLVENGFDILPIDEGKKYHREEGWQDKDYSASLNNSRSYSRHGVGIKTGRTPAIDVDILDQEIADKVVDIIEDVTDSEPPSRIGKPPKILFPFRVEYPMKKQMSKTYVDPDGNEHRVEILGDGQQFVAYHIHPDTGEPYEWPDGELTDILRDDLPLLTKDHMVEIIERSEALIESLRPDWKPKKADRKTAKKKGVDYVNFTKPDKLDPDKARDALSYLDVSDREDWLRAGMCLHQTGHPEARQIWEDWAQLWPDYEQAESDKAWDSFSHAPEGGKLTMKHLYQDAADAGWPKGVKLKDKPGTEFRLMFGGEVRQMLGPMDWAIDGILPVGMAELFGPPKQYKTFTVMSMCCAVATGKDWFGHAVEQGLVVYIAGEGNRNLARRYEAWIRYHDVDPNDIDPHIVFSNRSTDLSDEERVDDVIEQIKATGQIPKLIVIDTLARNFGAGNENDTADMNRVIAHAEKMNVEFPDSTVLFIHHTGISTTERGRGNSALFGAIDIDIRVSVNDSKTIEMECRAVKDAEMFPTLHFKPERVKLGFQEKHGQDATSVVLVPERGRDARAAFMREHPDLFGNKRSKLGERVCPVLAHFYDNPGAEMRDCGRALEIGESSIRNIVAKLTGKDWLDAKERKLTAEGCKTLRVLSDDPRHVLAGLNNA